MLLSEIHPFVRQALIGQLERENRKDVNRPLKTVDGRLFAILSGSGRMRFGDESHPLQPGTVILFSSGTEYVWEVERVRYLAVNFDYTQEHSDLRRGMHPFPSAGFDAARQIPAPVIEDAPCLSRPLILPHAQHLEPVISQIMTEFCLGGPRCDDLTSSLLRSVILSAVRVAEAGDSPKEAGGAVLARQMVAYLSAHFDEPLSNEAIAQHFNFHSVYCNRVFRAHTGQSIHDFLIGRRIGAAMEMLRSQCCSVSETAAKCGFSELCHFSRCFKKRVGVTPSEYRSGTAKTIKNKSI